MEYCPIGTDKPCIHSACLGYDKENNRCLLIATMQKYLENCAFREERYQQRIEKQKNREYKPDKTKKCPLNKKQDCELCKFFKYHDEIQYWTCDLETPNLLALHPPMDSDQQFVHYSAIEELLTKMAEKMGAIPMKWN